MWQIATDGVVWSVCMLRGLTLQKRLNRSRCRLTRTGPHIHVLHGDPDPPREGAILRMGMPRHASSRFTKGNGSLGRRCGLLSNYFDLLFCLLSYDNRDSKPCPLTCVQCLVDCQGMSGVCVNAVGQPSSDKHQLPTTSHSPTQV